MVATKTDGLVTYTGFDPADNGKTWITEKGNYTYVHKQNNEWSVSIVTIAAYDLAYLKEAKRCRYVTPSYSIEKRIIDGGTAYHFWKGKDYWFFNKDEAIKFILDSWTQEKWKEIYDVLDDMDVKYDTNYCDSEKEALIEFWTDTADQDIPTEFDYDGTPEDFVKQFTERAEIYDVDEEVELYVGMRGKNGVPNTVRELINDCQEAKDTLMEIAEKLQKAIK